MRSAFLGWVLAVALLAFSPGSGAAEHTAPVPDESFDEYVAGAARLEGRLLAPCCWDSSRQTLDIHGSPVSNELRREIRNRLRGGETSDAIEADLVRRYTTKILAAPTGSPLPRLGPLLAAGLLGAAALAISVVMRWRRRSKALAREATPIKPGAADEWDARLDAELEEQE